MKIIKNLLQELNSKNSDECRNVYQLLWLTKSPSDSIEHTKNMIRTRMARESAIIYLKEIGWLQEHERQVYQKAIQEYVYDSDYLVPTQEIVRCKDCKYADEYGFCEHVNWYNTVDDFCSRGERKDNEH